MPFGLDYRTTKIDVREWNICVKFPFQVAVSERHITPVIFITKTPQYLPGEVRLPGTNIRVVRYEPVTLKIRPAANTNYTVPYASGSRRDIRYYPC